MTRDTLRTVRVVLALLAAVIAVASLLCSCATAPPADEPVIPPLPEVIEADVPVHDPLPLPPRVDRPAYRAMLEAALAAPDLATKLQALEAVIRRAIAYSDDLAAVLDPLWPSPAADAP